MEYICPHCKKPIYDDDALLCLYCGESLNRPRFQLLPKIMFTIIVIIVLVCFLYAMLTNR
jgi:predicted nucleic acid-binding Zn ribbon protein